MQWTQIKRGLSVLLGGSALVLAAACGGGDKSPTGPGSGGDNNTLQFKLTSLGRMGLPADVAVEDCILTRFYSGGLTVHRDGSWQIKLKIHDDNLGDWAYADNGTYEGQDNDPTVWFNSQVTGANFEATVDGPEVAMMYDWCEDGVPDVQLVFQK